MAETPPGSWWWARLGGKLLTVSSSRRRLTLHCNELVCSHTPSYKELLKSRTYSWLYRHVSEECKKPWFVSFGDEQLYSALVRISCRESDDCVLALVRRIVNPILKLSTLLWLCLILGRYCFGKEVLG